MAILDLQLKWHWVWVLNMGSSYYIRAFHSIERTRITQQKITTAKRFMTNSIIPLQIILVSKIWIYLPSPLMIDPDRIKEHAIPLIWYQLPSLLPLQILLLLWLPLMIWRNSLCYLLMILNLLMQYWNIIFAVSGCK